MNRGDAKLKSELLELKGKARLWDKRKDKYMSENLSDEEQKVMHYFDVKYGTGDNTFGWTPEEEETYLQLKNKALEGPDTKYKIPDEILIEAGLKEDPRSVKAAGGFIFDQIEKGYHPLDDQDIKDALDYLGYAATGKIQMGTVLRGIQDGTITRKDLADLEAMAAKTAFDPNDFSKGKYFARYVEEMFFNQDIDIDDAYEAFNQTGDGSLLNLEPDEINELSEIIDNYGLNGKSSPCMKALKMATKYISAGVQDYDSQRLLALMSKQMGRPEVTVYVRKADKQDFERFKANFANDVERAGSSD